MYPTTSCIYRSRLLPFACVPLEAPWGLEGVLSGCMPKNAEGSGRFDSARVTVKIETASRGLNDRREWSWKERALSGVEGYSKSGLQSE